MKIYDLKTYEVRQSFLQCKIWIDTRAVKLSNDPLCEECLKQNILTPATQVHHRISIVINPTYENALEMSNLVSICQTCHSKITAEENKPKKILWKPLHQRIYKWS